MLCVGSGSEYLCGVNRGDVLLFAAEANYEPLYSTQQIMESNSTYGVRPGRENKLAGKMSLMVIYAVAAAIVFLQLRHFFI